MLPSTPREVQGWPWEPGAKRVPHLELCGPTQAGPRCPFGPHPAAQGQAGCSQISSRAAQAGWHLSGQAGEHRSPG